MIPAMDIEREKNCTLPLESPVSTPSDTCQRSPEPSKIFDKALKPQMGNDFIHTNSYKLKIRDSLRPFFVRCLLLHFKFVYLYFRYNILKINLLQR